MRPAPPPPSLLGPLRRPAPVIIAVAVLVFAVLAWRYAGDAGAGRVDARADSAVDAVTGGRKALLMRVTSFGSPPSVVLWAALLAGAALLLRRRRLALLAVVGPGLTGLATTVLKPLIGRTIGGGAGEAGYAFPSGHTGGASSIGLVVALLLVGLIPVARTGPAVAMVAAIALLAGGAVGAGMVSLGAHYATDTIGGFCAAVAIGLGSAMVIDRIAATRTAKQTPRPPRVR
ncbi:phosphatase PAP2 family protein [Pseudonocardia phyllosphaerae]|uniref:phosphatase PAP2 family protein n=1 Tax=Pseudonocardia phyllosphaerae TaxID=3390502 RepID=UPI00397C8CBA